MRRILFVVNVLIAIALVAAGAAFYWFVYRALPKTSGTIETFVNSRVRVDRDLLGVPYIKADNLDDVWFVEGYTTAEDRMFQMDGLRRLAAGELSEIIGPSTVEADREARRLRMRRIAEQIYTEMPDSDKKAMQAYARGINAWIESHRGRYGVEFVLINYDPKPWSVVDSILCGLQMFRTLTNDWKTKLIKQQMLRNGEPDKVNFLFPYRTGFEFAPGGGPHPGSNAWAVSGAHSATGKPLLSSDMHLEFSLPGIWHMERLEAPGMDVTGVSLPGMPGIISGHNDRIAWGETNLEFDVQDLYNERIDLRTGQYLSQGKVEQARSERELITVRGRGVEEMTAWVTHHGPVFEVGNGQVNTLRWTAAEPGLFQDVFLDIDRARNWDDFKRALSRFGGPGQNFVYADVDGNIGYHVGGKLPIRRNYYGDVPVDGSSGNYEWDGYIPFDELPQAYNPPAGYIVTANQNPFPADYPYHVSGRFAAPYRSRQILDMLRASGDKLQPQNGLRIQKDVYSGFNKFLAHRIAAVYKDRQGTNKTFDAATSMLTAWDGQMDRDRAEPLITTLTFQYLRKAIAERASPGSGEIYELQIAPAVVEKILREKPAGWFGDYNELLLRSFADAMEEGQRMQGADPKRWKWGRYMYLTINNPVVGRIPVIGKYFNIGPVPMSGGSNTVKQTTLRLGPSERMNVSLGDWDKSLMNLPIGESGHVASSHYRDQWDAYYNATSFPLGYTFVNARSTVMFVPKK
ncbi:MAG TPA: penicillin acylase family protein [Bryobacteraceae bacterium]|nr:penicillin acylase family protein [Bryobacteraceae bacterium]